jgi:signal transduction histidine kinase/ActR/RegA family two-component response regulator
MRGWRLLLLALAGLMLAPTYFLVQAATPDAALHERTLGALRSLALSDAAQQRDVLRARAGLLRNYDPLGSSSRSLRAAASDLRSAGHVAKGAALAEIERRVGDIAAAVRDQETLVENLKSRNALLQNSLSYFMHTIARVGADSDGRQPRAPAEIGELANVMLGFLQEPRGEAARRIVAVLDRLERLDARAELQQDVRALISHGRLIAATLPEVDEIVARLQAVPIADRGRELLDAYLRLYGRAAARADAFRLLLYAASVALAAYVSYLFLRLRAQARRLQMRLDFENMIADVSSRFIGLARDAIGDGIREGLARIAQHTAVERAYVALQTADEAGTECNYHWSRPGVPMPHRPEDLHALAAGWDLADYERQGCVHVGSVRSLPDGPEKACLRDNGVRSWLCVPMWLGGRRIGSLSLDTVSFEKRWAGHDIALLRTAGEIFANAIARERHEREREALETRLAQAHRLEALGTLAGGIAHEFNNVLGAILGYGEMALAALRGQGPAQRYLQQVMTAGRRAQAIIDQVLAFGRRSERRHHPVRVQPIVSDALDLLRPSLPGTITLRPQLDAQGATVRGDPTRLQQVLINLATNAAQAMQGGGTIDIALDIVDLARERAISHGGLPAGRYARLAVSDTGEGMDAGVMARIFEPFFTTKAAPQGTGLGLPTVHGIVAQHGGALDVQSKPGKGSTFEVYLPLIEATAAAEDAPAMTSAPRGHGETILIVDDERPLVLLAEEMLAALGYEPVGFDDSTAALAALQADPRRFDLVLTDEVMSGLTGTELAMAVHEVRPELPVVLMTGHRPAARASQAEAARIREVITKPLLSAHLASAVARHVGARARVRS